MAELGVREQRTAEVGVITGASAGIGRAAAREFARHGCKVALLARGRAGLEAAAREVEERGGEALVSEREEEKNMHDHPQSTAKIGDHPIHPMLIPFPIVCFILTFICDIIYARGETGIANATNWLLGFGLVMAALAAVAGLTDFFGEKRIQGADAIKHMLANVVAVVLEVVNLLLRLNNPDFIASTGVYISGVVVLILLYSGWKGGDLVYRHGMGVRDTPEV
jgi:uncharacterized membrane protein